MHRWLVKIRQRIFGLRLPQSLRKILAFVAILMGDIRQTQLPLHASSMAYMSLGSIVPCLALTFAIANAFQPIAAPNASWFQTLKSFILRNLAPDSGQDIIAYLESFLANIDVTKIGVTGFLTLIVVLILLLRDIETALNSIWQVNQTRTFLKRFMFFWITTTLGTLCISIIVTAFSHWYSFDGWSVTAVALQSSTFLSDLINIVLIFVFFTVLQKIGPNCHVSMKAALVGGCAATLLIRLASAGFGLYAVHSQWNQNIYEALAVVPLFLLWLYLAWFVILFSAVIAWRTHHGWNVQRAPDSIPTGSTAEKSFRLRNLHIRALIPFLCVMMAAMRFREGRGQGYRVRQLANDLDIPPFWVREGLQAAEKLGLVLIKRPNEDEHEASNDALDSMIYPSFPPERLTLAELLLRLTEDTRSWLEAKPMDMPIPLRELLENTWESLRTDRGRASIDNLLRRCDESRTSEEV